MSVSVISERYCIKCTNNVNSYDYGIIYCCYDTTGLVLAIESIYHFFGISAKSPIDTSLI